MLYLTCTSITSVDLKYYGVSRAKDWVSVDCGTKLLFNFFGVCLASKGPIYSEPIYSIYFFGASRNF